MSAFLPPETDALVAAVVSRNLRRARALRSALADLADSAGHRECVRALESTLASLKGPDRDSLLHGASMRAWLAATETAVLLARPPAQMTDLDLFETIAKGPHLQRLAPKGRLDRSFRRRARALGRQILRRCFARLPLEL